MTLEPSGFRLSVKPAVDGRYTIVARTSGVGPAFGLADHAAFNRTTTELTGFELERFRAAVQAPVPFASSATSSSPLARASRT